MVQTFSPVSAPSHPRHLSRSQQHAPATHVNSGAAGLRPPPLFRHNQNKSKLPRHPVCSPVASRWKGTPGFSKGESWIPAGTRGTLGSRSCRRVPLESDVNFQLKQSNRGFSFSASHLIWILASPPGIAGFRAGRPAARDPAEVVTSVLLGTHEHTRKTNCMEKSLLSLNCMTVHDLCRPSPAL